MARRRAFAIFFLTLIAAYPALMRTSRQMQSARKPETRTPSKPAPVAPLSERGVAQRIAATKTDADTAEPIGVDAVDRAEEARRVA